MSRSWMPPTSRGFRSRPHQLSISHMNRSADRCSVSNDLAEKRLPPARRPATAPARRAATGSRSSGLGPQSVRRLVPRLVEQHVVCTRPHRRCTVGYLSSYVLFALGWVLFGLSSLRARLLPGALSIAIVVGGLVGFKAASPPFGLALGVALT